MATSTRKYSQPAPHQKIRTVYSKTMITRKIILPIVNIGKNLYATIETYISANFEGKCLVEGYVKPGSIVIVTFSSGTIERGSMITYTVVFECSVCFPVDGMIIQCIAKNITKAGIRAESSTDSPSPIIVFIARDHSNTSRHFLEITEGDIFNVRVIGQRFELNDTYVSIIGSVVKPRT